MDVNEIYNKGVAAFEADQYETAINYFQQAAETGHVDAEAYLPIAYYSLAAEISSDASRHTDNTEYLVRGQQKAVQLMDITIRSALNFLRRHPDDLANGNSVGLMISRSFYLQYILVATGLTTAYRLTATTRTIEKTNWGDVTLWEEIVGEETNSFVSFNSYDMRDYHIFGDDERTKRIEQSKETILRNATQVAALLGYMGREYDAMMVRAAVACQMADCENGIRSMLLAADWFLCRGMELAREALTNGDDTSMYDSWYELNDINYTDYQELERKYGALLRQMKRDGMRPYLNRFYHDPAAVPKIEECALYGVLQEATADLNKKGAVKGDGFAAFLSVFAQASNQKVIPVVVFSSVVGLFMGGLFNMFRADAGIFIKILIGVWMVITLLLTLIRSVKDADVTTSTRSFRAFMGIRFGIAIVFAINFFLGLIAFIVLKILSKPYR